MPSVSTITWRTHIGVRRNPRLSRIWGEDAKEGDKGVVKTKIGAVFKPGKKMLFLFDYGDDWMFPVTCTGEGEASVFKRAKILATTGKPPVQYPDTEEE